MENLGEVRILFFSLKQPAFYYSKEVIGFQLLYFYYYLSYVVESCHQPISEWKKQRRCFTFKLNGKSVSRSI